MIWEAMEGTTKYRDEVKASPASQSGYAKLAAGILAHAAKEAKKGDQAAAQWLQTEQAEFLAGAIGLSFVHVKRWVHSLSA